MSTICGLYAKNGYVSDFKAESMFDKYNQYKFDISRTWQSESFFLGSHLNFVVPESFNEILPFCDENSGLTITADAIIDNREELFKLLEISPAEQNKISDSALILNAYKKWGVKCPEKLIGDFAFAIWDSHNHQLFLTTDHVGKRALYYYNSNEIFAFSTLINPLFQIDKIPKVPHDEYIADFLAIPNAATSPDHTITIFKDIFHLPPATSMLICKDKIQSWQYWQVNANLSIRFQTDAEYEAAFLKIFTEAVKCRMRSTKKLGIMLSGGLDSGAIAVIVANEFRNSDQTLYGYTQVPIHGYQNKLPKSLIADEKPYVDELCQYYANIKPTYLDSENKNPLTVIDKRLDILEQPYKNFHNSHWIDEIHRVAGLEQIGILLDGQIGNGSVSNGDLNSYIVTLLQQRKYATCFREIKFHAKNNKRSVFRTILGQTYRNMPYMLKKIAYKIRENHDYFNMLSLINPDFDQQMKATAKIKDPYFLKSSNAFDGRMKMLGPECTSQLGANETKISLAYGVTRRDPTRDKRVIEFCMNIPEDQWVRDGLERRLIRVAMKDILPDKYRLNTTVRGKQAADWLQRIAPEWSQACEEIATIGDFALERKYLDIAKIKDRLAKNREIDPDETDNFDIWLLIRALIFARFLRKNFPENR